VPQRAALRRHRATTTERQADARRHLSAPDLHSRRTVGHSGEAPGLENNLRGVAPALSTILTSLRDGSAAGALNSGRFEACRSDTRAPRGIRSQ